MIIAVLEWLICAACCYVTLPFLIEVAAGLAVGKKSDTGPFGPLDTVIVMPAHNEAGTLPVTLSRLAAVLERERVLLVADNCLDNTATLARAAGVEVIEREDVLRIGKGYALAFAQKHLRERPPDVVVVLDADCHAEPGTLQRLAHMAHLRQTVVQAAYLLTPQRNASPMVQISSFAFVIKNLVRQRGIQRLHLAPPLNGTGMAFPWALFDAAPLERSSVVEDLVLTIDLLKADVRVEFDEHCRIWSDPAGESATLEQRQRWEGGFIATARTFALPLIVEGFRRRRISLIYFSAHLTTLPLALLILVQILSLGLTYLLYKFSTVLMPAQIIYSLVIGTLFSTLLVWAKCGQKWLTLGALCSAPLYVMWKAPIYFGALFTKPALQWTRTERTRWTEVAGADGMQLKKGTTEQSELLDEPPGSAEQSEPPVGNGSDPII